MTEETQNIEPTKPNTPEGNKQEPISRIQQTINSLERLDEIQKTTIPEMKGLIRKFEIAKAYKILEGRSTGNFKQESVEEKMDKEVADVIKDIY